MVVGKLVSTAFMVIGQCWPDVHVGGLSWQCVRAAFDARTQESLLIADELTAPAGRRQRVKSVPESL